MIKVKTIFIYPDGSIAKEFEGILYTPLNYQPFKCELRIGEVWKISTIVDEFVNDDWLIRFIHLSA